MYQTARQEGAGRVSDATYGTRMVQKKELLSVHAWRFPSGPCIARAHPGTTCIVLISFRSCASMHGDASPCSGANVQGLLPTRWPAGSLPSRKCSPLGFYSFHTHRPPSLASPCRCRCRRDSSLFGPRETLSSPWRRPQLDAGLTPTRLVEKKLKPRCDRRKEWEKATEPIDETATAT